MKSRYYIFVCIIALGWAGCKPYSPSPYKGMPKEYVLGYEEIYGHCYDSIPSAVVALDLYSDGLTLDQNHRIQGTGYNLYISDIFVPDSLLEEGAYKSIPQDSLSAFNFQLSSFRFLPGRDYEGLPHGIYVLKIEEDQIASIQVLDSGSFVYRNDSLLFTMYYKNAYGSRAKYTYSFPGPLIPWQKK